MKTLQILSGVAFAALLTFSTVQVNAADKLPAMENVYAKMQIRKVVVKGNVRVELIQGKGELITMEEQYLDKVMVTQLGDILTITSDNEVPIDITVQVNDIYRIDAADQSVVSTRGKLKLKNLQIFLRDEASAKINANTESLYTMINSEANLTLKGSTDSHTMNYAGLKNIKLSKFVALQTNRLEDFNLAYLQGRSTEK